MDTMSTLTEHELNDRHRAADATNHPDNADLRGFARHTVSSKFSLKLLKTNDGHPNKMTHIFEAGIRLQNPILTNHKSRIASHERF